MPNPDHAEQVARHAQALQYNPFATADHLCETLPPALTTRPDQLVDTDQLCVTADALDLIVSYPFPRRYSVRVVANRPGGFTRGHLFEQIVRVFHAMYDGAEVSPIPNLLNVRVESAFGAALHALEDLVVEDVIVERCGRTARAWIVVGS